MRETEKRTTEQREKNSGDLKRDMLWNTAGSLLYALSSMVLAFFVMRILGAEDGGIFGFGFSTFGQQMFIVAYFGIRPFHITDVKREYRFSDYRTMRRMTVMLAVLIAGLWLGLLIRHGQYTWYKGLVIFLLSAYKICDGYADLYESEFQRDGKLYLSGKLLFFRTLFCSGTLMAGLLGSGSLLCGAALALAAQLLSLFAYHCLGRECVQLDELSLKPAAETKRRFGNAAVSGLFLQTVLLFVSVFLDFYVFSAAKYAVDSQLGDAENGIFNLLFMPTNIIYLLANFVIKPFMTRLAEAYEGADLRAFSALSGKLSAMIGILMVLCIGGAVFLGKPVLSVCEFLLGEAYRGQLVSCARVFFLIIAGGGLYALANLFYYELVIMRRQREIFLIYALCAVLAYLLAPRMVARYGLKGAALAYVGLMFLLYAGFSLLCRILLFRRERQGE